MCLQKCQCGNDNVCHPRTGKLEEEEGKKTRIHKESFEYSRRM